MLFLKTKYMFYFWKIPFWGLIKWVFSRRGTVVWCISPTNVPLMGSIVNMLLPDPRNGSSGWKLLFVFPNLCRCLCLTGATFICWGRMKSYWESWRTWTHGSGERIPGSLVLFICFYWLSLSAQNIGLSCSLCLIFYTIHSKYPIRLHAIYLVPMKHSHHECMNLLVYDIFSNQSVLRTSVCVYTCE